MPVTTCSWDREGKRIAGGVGDGSIQVIELFISHSLTDEINPWLNNVTEL